MVVVSKRGGVLQTIVVGVIFSATPFGAPLIGAGIGLVAGGVVQMLSPQAGGLKTSAAPENTPGYAFGSAKNTTASGNPVTRCIGERRWAARLSAPRSMLKTGRRTTMVLRLPPVLAEFARIRQTSKGHR